MIHISKEKHTKLAMINFQTPLNYWGNLALFYSNKKVSVNPSFKQLSSLTLLFHQTYDTLINSWKNSTKEIWGQIKLSAEAEIQWWINNIDNSCHHINISNSDITIYTDKNLADGVSLMVYPHPGNSGIRQCQSTSMF